MRVCLVVQDHGRICSHTCTCLRIKRKEQDDDHLNPVINIKLSALFVTTMFVEKAKRFIIDDLEKASCECMPSEADVI